MTENLDRPGPTVLRVSADALDAPRDAADESGYIAWLAGPAGSGTARMLPIGQAEEPYDLIIVDYEGSTSHSRSWVRHARVDGLVIYSLLAASPASFPSPSHALAG